jgi:retron-type reverse transcriptase
MDKDKYIKRLIKALKDSGKGIRYIETCVKYSERLIENNLPVIFDTIHLSLLIGTSDRELYKMMQCDDLYYNLKYIPKKNGKFRELQIPAQSLKYVQRWILDNILNNISVSEHATGFIKGKSIVTNAKKHLNTECVISFDIKNFFPSIYFKKIFLLFYYYGYTKELSYILAKLCTYKDILPQGSPASPYLSNIICLKLDKRLSCLATTFKANYTRYADDITFSGNKNIQKFTDTAKKIIMDEGFEINPNKTRIRYKHERQEVTGLLVNSNKPNVKKSIRKSIWQEIYYCKKFGVVDHLKKISSDKAFYKEHLYGKVYFIKMVNQEEGVKMLRELECIEWGY